MQGGGLFRAGCFFRCACWGCPDQIVCVLCNCLLASQRNAVTCGHQPRHTCCGVSHFAACRTPALPVQGAVWQSHGSNSAAVAAATAQAHAALAVLLQHQQQADGALPTQLAQLQRAVAVATHTPGGVAPAGANGGLLGQRLGQYPLGAGQHAQHAQLAHLPSGASASQLTAVLNNLTALRRSGSMPAPAHSASSGSLGSLPPAHSLPLPGQPGCQPSQADLLQQLLLQQQQMGGGLGLDGFAGAAGAAGVAPSQQIHQLSSMLASQSLGGGGLAQQPARTSTPMLTPQASGHLLSPQHSTGSLPGLTHQMSGMLSPQHSGQMQLSAHPHHAPGAQQSLAAAFGQLGGSAHSVPPPHSPAAHHGLGQPAGGMGQQGSLPSSLPQHFICPLSRQVMTDPVRRVACWVWEAGPCAMLLRLTSAARALQPGAWAVSCAPGSACLPRVHLHCPLTSDCAMRSVQVIAADGVTYERQAISEWLAFK